MPDDLHIDLAGSASTPNEEGRRRLSGSAGTWQLLGSQPDLLLAVRGQEAGLLADLNQLEPSGAVLAGDLAEMQPSDLLNFLHQGRRTGVLLTRTSDVERGIVLLEGNVAWACSTSPGERLGELLCRRGSLTHDRLETILAAQGGATSARKLGQLLVDNGLLNERQIEDALRMQVVEVFLGLLVATTGSFVFLRGCDVDKLPARLGMDTQALLLDGLRRLDEMELYRGRIPGPEVKPLPTGKPLPPPDDDGLPPEARALFPWVDGLRTLAELAVASALGEFEATKAAYKLLEGGYVRLERARAVGV